MGWTDDLVKGVTSGDFLSSAFSTIAGTVMNSLESNSERDDLEEQRRYDEEMLNKKNALDLQLMAIKAKYAGGGGGGGGQSGKLTDAQRLTSMQNTTDSKLAALNSLLAGIQGPLGQR